MPPHEAQREAKSALVGGGLVVGATSGGLIGAAVAGPVGILAGAALGAVAGVAGGAAAGTAVGPADSHDTHNEGNSGDSDTGAAPADTVHLHIEDSGSSGRPLVLIHGWPLSAQAWAPQLSALQAAGFRVVAYDRRGFGRSDKPVSGYDYDTLADDLHRVMADCDLRDATLVGFSMGGGEVARCIARHGESRLRSAVFVSAVTPCLMKSADNPDGPLTADAVQHLKSALEQDRPAFFDQFTEDFFSTQGVMRVTESQRAEAVALCHQSAQPAALACLDAFAHTDFREDLQKVTVPTLVIHGEADAIVPIEGSGLHTHRAVAHSQLVALSNAPHCLNVSHAQAFNDALLSFLRD